MEPYVSKAILLLCVFQVRPPSVLLTPGAQPLKQTDRDGQSTLGPASGTDITVQRLPPSVVKRTLAPTATQCDGEGQLTELAPMLSFTRFQEVPPSVVRRTNASLVFPGAYQPNATHPDDDQQETPVISEL